MKINQMPTQAEHYKLPLEILENYEKHPLLGSFLVSATGYFLEARGHHLMRDPIGETVLIYCTKGKGYYQMNDHVHTIEPGMLLCCWFDVMHHYWADPENPWTIHWLHCRGTDVLKFLEHCGYQANQPVLQLGVLPKLMETFNEILETFKRGYHLESQVRLSVLLHQLLMLVAVEVAEGLPQKKEDRFADILTYMNENLTENIPIETLAKQCHLSVGYFFRKFKKKYGFSPLDFLNRLKVQKACNELVNTDKSIKEIAQGLGFEDALYFSRLFHNIMSLSPKAYRLQEANGISLGIRP